MSWIKDLPDEVRSLDYSRASLRKFGLTVGLVLAGIGIFLLRRRPESLPGAVLAGVGGLLVLAGLVFPSALRLVYSGWMTLAFLIGGVVSRVILFLMFALVFTPLGWFGRLLGLPFAKLRLPPAAGSQWIERKSQPTRESYEQLY